VDGDTQVEGKGMLNSKGLMEWREIVEALKLDTRKIDFDLTRVRTGQLSYANVE
jgi:hypothetical protein